MIFQRNAGRLAGKFLGKPLYDFVDVLRGMIVVHRLHYFFSSSSPNKQP